MAFLTKITICDVYGKYFANPTDSNPCVSFVATGRQREEESRGLKQHLKMTSVTSDMSSGYSSATSQGIGCPVVHGLTGEAAERLFCFQESHALSVTPFNSALPQLSRESVKVACVPAVKRHSSAVSD